RHGIARHRLGHVARHGRIAVVPLRFAAAAVLGLLLLRLVAFRLRLLRVALFGGILLILFLFVLLLIALRVLLVGLLLFLLIGLDWGRDDLDPLLLRQAGVRPRRHIAIVDCFEPVLNDHVRLHLEGCRILASGL